GVSDNKLLLDLSYREDSTAELDMNVIMTGGGKFVEIQGTAEKEPFTKKDMERLLDLARKGIKELINLQKKVLKKKI
ncbi:MAG: ribonuclease PH, partial [Candidatus Omnitrophica bacterium]|nr:ribonuclease PH [Candidatus Omnitrophota bacterium]